MRSLTGQACDVQGISFSHNQNLPFVLESDRQFFAAQNMEMQMFHGLACVLANIGDDAVAAGNYERLSMVMICFSIRLLLSGSVHGRF